MQELTARPPFVTFETRGVEDRNESIKLGHYVARDVDFAIITPQGSKDRIERQADEWFTSLLQNAQEERFPMQWYSMFQERYKAWKLGQTLPETGTAIKNWSVPSPSQVQALLNAGITTVEDLAVCNEEALARLGMGGRQLRDRAKSWLDQASRVSAPSEQLAALELANKELAETNAKLMKQLQEISARLTALEPAPPIKKL